MTTYTIYDHPADFPTGFVVRAWHVLEGGVLAAGEARTARTLKAARELVPAGLHRLDRQPGDDPTIVETWL